MGGYHVAKNNTSVFNTIGADSPLTVQKLFQLPAQITNEFYEIIPCRVTYIDNNPSGKIKFKKLAGDDKEHEFEAYPLNSIIKKFPLIGEVVLIVEYPVGGNNKEKFEKLKEINFDSNSNYYYIDILNTKNRPSKLTYNLIPIGNTESDGDIIFQGRNNQSIRFSSSLDKNFKNKLNLLYPSVVGSSNTLENRIKLKNTWVYGNSAKNPIIVISNGHQNVYENSYILEDINKDDSSIYLTSDNIIPLEINKGITSKFLINSGKLQFNFAGYEFSGKQIISVSDTLVFKSRKDTLFFSDGITSFHSTDSIVFTSGKDIVLEPIDATGKILLGKPISGVPYSSVAKSDELIQLLNTLLNSLENDFTHKDNIKAISVVKACKRDLKKIKSEVTFTL